MGKPTRIYELRNGEGKLLFSVSLVERDLSQQGGPPAPNNKRPEPRKDGGQGNGHGNGEFMSEAQRRYLFRILADQGIEGENAYGHLRNLFGVSNLKEVSKLEASRAISQLLEGGGEQGGLHDGPPF